MRLTRIRPSPLAEAVLVALGLAIFYLLLRTSPFLVPGTFSDDGVYLALGKALAEGEGYRSIYAVGEPVHARYPPGLPAVYAVLWWLGSDLTVVNSAALLLSLIVTSLAAGLVWWLARVRLGLGVPVSLFFALGPFLLEGSVQYFNLAVSEPYYMALWAAALALFHSLSAGGPFGGVDGDGGAEAEAKTGRLAVALGAVVAVAVLFRSQGIVLVPAVLLGLLLTGHRMRTVALFSAAAVVPVAAWRVWHARALLRGPAGTQPDEQTYGSWTPEGGLWEVPGMLFELMVYQVRSYGTYMPSHLSGFWPAGLMLWLAVGALAAVGGVRLWRRHPDLVFACAASVAVILLWPWWQDRFVLTILPFVGLLAGSEVERWQTGIAVRKRGVAVLLAVLALGVGFKQVGIRTAPAAESVPQVPGEGERPVASHPAHYLPNNSRYLLAANLWIQQNTAPDATLVAPHPVGIWLSTGRRVVNSTPALPDVGPSIWDEPGRFLAERLVRDRPDLVVLANLVYDIAVDISVLQQTCPEALEFLGLTDRYARVAFYRVRYDDPCLQERVLEPTRRTLGG
jgi:hypothetical protein